MKPPPSSQLVFILIIIMFLPLRWQQLEVGVNVVVVAVVSVSGSIRVINHGSDRDRVMGIRAIHRDRNRLGENLMQLSKSMILHGTDQIPQRLSHHLFQVVLATRAIRVTRVIRRDAELVGAGRAGDDIGEEEVRRKPFRRTRQHLN